MSAPKRLRLLAAPVLTAGLLVATPGLSPAEAAGGTRHEKISHARRIATHQIGDPYRYGAEGPGRFDCSGLIYFSFRRAGFGRARAPRQDQADHARRVRKAHLRRGDFMFFHDRGGVYHDAIFLRWSRRRPRRDAALAEPAASTCTARSPWTSRLVRRHPAPPLSRRP